jgi:actin related protein 2/3 complex subunit 5
LTRTSRNRGDIAGCLRTVLENAPYGPNVEDAKVCRPLFLTHSCPSQPLPFFGQNLNLQTLVTILNSTKATDIPSVLKSLSIDEQDTLMKYLYKGMGMPGWGDLSGSVLLGWHEKVFTFTRLMLSALADRLEVVQLTEVAGVGCIVRVMTDRRTV